MQQTTDLQIAAGSKVMITEADKRFPVCSSWPSKRLDAGYSPGQCLWLKTKCLNREEFVVVGWTDPEGSRPFIGALLLGYYDPDGRLIYAGRVGSGMRADQLADLLTRLGPLQTDRMPLDVAPPRSTRFGSPLVLSRVHWVRP
jgi:ATP-dependent DNA ligase